MEYTGERVVKEPKEITIYYVFFEHIYRYCFARRYCRNKVVLDAGCGTGYGTYELSKSARKVIGIDISKEAIDFCKNNYAQPNIEFLEMDIRNMKFEEDFFDCMVSFETLEHIEEQEKFLEEVKRVLKPGGLFIISTPDRESYHKRFAGGNHNRFHKKDFSRAEFECLLKKYLNIERLYGQVVIRQADKNFSISGVSGNKSLSHTFLRRKKRDLFKDFVRRTVVKNAILYNLFVILTLKKRRYAVKPLNEKKDYVYLIAVCINVP